MISLDQAAHWAELISAIIGSGAAVKVWRFVNHMMNALHEHAETDGVLEAKGIRKVLQLFPAKGD